ncbi:hypothetical protein GQR58_030642 [Nymphon striatum]|nr:hypothetical protein GQR58_030642 [Nymphon striatum]
MKPAVGWFSVKLLIMTGIQALITSLVGPRSARREVLAVLDGHGSTEVCHNSAVNNISAGFDFRNASENSSDEIWIDYVADLGDGFNGTHSVSWLLGRDFLFLKKANDPVEQPIPVDSFSEAKRDAVKDADHVLPAGNILIFGGDQVYPAASQIDYQDRTIGPYYASRPWSDYNPAGPDDEGRRIDFFHTSKRRVPLIIAGDYHYYTHHQSDEPEQKDKSHYIICGGGGAFTLGTATVPKKVNISNTSTAEHQVSFPDEKDSIEKRVGVFWLFYHHKFFCTLLSSIMLAVVWLVHTSSLSLLDPSTIFSGPVTKETQITSISGPFLETARFSLHSWLGFKR